MAFVVMAFQNGIFASLVYVAALVGEREDSIRSGSSIATDGLSSIASSGPITAMLCSIVILWWCLAMICQGEGLELDVQRRRYPMWEWLLSHPVSPAAVFFAEMLSPVAANPAYITAPIFLGAIYGLAYADPMLGIIAAILVGIPVALATACIGKALEVAAMVRLSVRNRGAVIGFMSWIGQASLAVAFFAFIAGVKNLDYIANVLQPLSTVPWPLIGLVLGETNLHLSFGLGLLSCDAAAIIAITASVLFTVWAIGRGLTATTGVADVAPARTHYKGSRFDRAPLYRKELLWLKRDRSALIQIFLVPLTLASFQLFNMRYFLQHAQDAWNYLCGVAVVFGTYLLWVLGPRSLASEGPALWIALTWPRGLEGLLKAKAWLWARISSVVVLVMLLYTAYRFPSDTWKIALVAIAWFVFANSMAEKAVTLVTVPASSGEPEKIPWTRRFAASLGMLTFAIGVSTAQWQLAIVGIVYSYITAAAMWQNFRARLPFLYDPWSERLPPAPSLMHAMVAISILVEGAAIIATAELIFVPDARAAIGTVQALAYGVAAVGVFFGASHFLSGRGISQSAMWTWAGAQLDFDKKVLSIVLAIAVGIGLGLFAHGYTWMLMQIPSIAEPLRQSERQLAQTPDLWKWYAVMAIGFAPFAEEFLFRGLLFRALDREWGGWRAVLGSAAFFASYHPVTAWIPVGILGAVNALMFKRTGWLTTAVIAHMVYNAVVVL
ncbi:MAG: CPBP family intramembrane glutamic endopeptidase [Vulcanimicrobiaceae bacterium]|jgi:membrane protease YdiL (CAAX protease family)